MCLSLFCYTLLYVLSTFAIILTRKRELVALLLLSFGYLATGHVLWLFLTVPWTGLQFEAMVFPDHTHLRFELVEKSHSKCNKAPAIEGSKIYLFICILSRKIG